MWKCVSLDFSVFYRTEFSFFFFFFSFFPPSVEPQRKFGFAGSISLDTLLDNNRAPCMIYSRIYGACRRLLKDTPRSSQPACLWTFRVTKSLDAWNRWTTWTNEFQAPNTKYQPPLLTHSLPITHVSFLKFEAAQPAKYVSPERTITMSRKWNVACVS